MSALGFSEGWLEVCQAAKRLGYEEGSAEWAVYVRREGRAYRMHGHILDSEILDTVGRVSEAEDAVVRKVPAWLLACDEGGDGIALLVEPEREVEIGSILQHLESRFGLSLAVFRERWADRGRVGLVLRYDEAS